MGRLDRTFWPTLGLIVGVIALFELTTLDLWVQDHFFNVSTGRWAVTEGDAGLRIAFYHAPKILIALVGVAVLVLAAGPERWRRTTTRRSLLVVVCTLISTPVLVGLGKTATNIFCPAEIMRYGGDAPYVRLCEPYPADQRPLRRGRCFPAGHASGGFALLSLAGLARTTHGRRTGMAVGLMIGGAMGIYQMMNGAHYLSHTLVTALLAWWLFVGWRRIFRVDTNGASGGAAPVDR